MMDNQINTLNFVEKTLRPLVVDASDRLSLRGKRINIDDQDEGELGHIVKEVNLEAYLENNVFKADLVPVYRARFLVW